ncbi:unnamed protein product [Porites evermanni]|uniref:Uncharacterized protein n=1 Tax=Porites evermanni TaxID=104178 RepID=A0ABN8LRZ1_9CNID|nr:unnamed protein product [Porites evermanni]
MRFTWFNVNAGYDNQLNPFSSDSGTNFTNMSFLPGVWNYSDFDSYIKQKTVIKSSRKDDEYRISLAFDETIFKVTITLKTNYQLDFTKFNFYELIGCDKKVLTALSNVGTKVPNLSQDTDILNIHCDLVSDSLVDGEENDIVYSFSTSVLRTSYNFILQPRRITYNPINKQTISSVRIDYLQGNELVRSQLEDVTRSPGNNQHQIKNGYKFTIDDISFYDWYYFEVQFQL